MFILLAPNDAGAPFWCSTICSVYKAVAVVCLPFCVPVLCCDIAWYFAVLVGLILDFYVAMTPKKSSQKTVKPVPKNKSDKKRKRIVLYLQRRLTSVAKSNMTSPNLC